MARGCLASKKRRIARRARPAWIKQGHIRYLWHHRSDDQETPTTNLTQLLCLKLVRLTPHTWSTHDLWDSQSQRPLVFRNLRIPVDKTASWSSAQHDQLFCCNSATAHQIRSWWQVAPKCEDDLFCGKNYVIPCPYIEERYISHMFHPFILVVCSCGDDLAFLQKEIMWSIVVCSEEQSQKVAPLDTCSCVSSARL